MKASVVRAFGLLASVLLASVAGAQSTQPVEWKASDGGNGHWYQGIVQDGITWTQARTAALAVHGDLACLGSQQESDFVYQRIASNGVLWNNRIGPWIGLYQLPGSIEPAGGWQWVDGSPLAYTTWFADHPIDGWGGGPGCNVAHYTAVPAPGNSWGVDPDFHYPVYHWENFRSYIIEWSADCNNDGIVDYGQIRSGQLADDNANGIPDICETSITGVLPPSVPAQGGSTITINGRNFPAQPSVLVGGVAATNVVRVSDSRLTAVTPAQLPGMAPLTVNGFTLPDAIYIRPECGSDLDQNGTVDAGDISIILLDFGPCYEPPAALAAPAPTPLLADEPAQKPTQR